MRPGFGASEASRYFTKRYNKGASPLYLYYRAFRIPRATVAQTFHWTKFVLSEPCRHDTTSDKNAGAGLAYPRPTFVFTENRS